MQASPEKGHDHLAATFFAAGDMVFADHLLRIAAPTFLRRAAVTPAAATEEGQMGKGELVTELLVDRAYRPVRLHLMDRDWFRCNRIGALVRLML
jgi:hypothetical protein